MKLLSLFFVVLQAHAMTSQAKEVQVTFDSSSSCGNDCYMVANVTDRIYTNDMNGKTSGSQSGLVPTTYVIFRAYSITSAYLSNGVCVTISGGAITFSNPYSILRPFDPYDDASFRKIANSKFQSYAGFTGCSAGGSSATPTQYEKVIPTTDATGALPRTWIVPAGLATSTSPATRLNPVASINSTSSLRSFASASPTNLVNNSASPNLRAKVQIIIAVVIPLSIIAIILSYAVLRCKHHTRRPKSRSLEDVGSENDSSQYFQQKPELHGDQCRHEMPAEDKRYEIEAEEMRHQLHADHRLELEARHCRCHFRHELEAPTGL